ERGHAEAWSSGGARFSAPVLPKIPIDYLVNYMHPPSMPRKSDAKERLMNAAMDLIWEHSYGSTSVDAICEKAGAKKGSFYYFFESKSDLAVAALESDWQRK